MDTIKKILNGNKIFSRISRAWKPQRTSDNQQTDFKSGTYWEGRYAKGGNSGAGSYGRLALFKAEVINDFVEKNNIQSVIEFGCGDGNQTSLFKIPHYTGLDVSRTCIDLCKKKFASDTSKDFFLSLGPALQADLTLSLDVIYHLTEDPVFEKYMRDLFSHSKKYVMIYSTNDASIPRSQHVLHRKFSELIEKECPCLEIAHDHKEQISDAEKLQRRIPC